MALSCLVSCTVDGASRTRAGAPEAAGRGEDVGAARSASGDPLVALQQAKLVPSDAAALQQFATTVSLSGDTALVGAPLYDDRGAAYVFVRSGAGWTQQAKLVAGDGADFDQFGAAVSLDGDTAVVVAPHREPSSAYVFVRNGASWTQQAVLAPSGGAAADGSYGAVAVEGDTLVVGAANADGTTGAADVYVRNGSTWAQQATLTADDGTHGDSFGGSVSLSGDTALVGAYGETYDTGAAYVFVRSGASWSQQAKLTASDGGVFDLFGNSVSVSGDTALVGAPYYDGPVGAAYVFARSGASWTEQARLMAGDGKQGEYFGDAVTVSGDVAVVGAYGNPSSPGAARIFVRDGASWIEQAKIAAADGNGDDFFGDSVSLSGSTLLVAASGNAGYTGAAYAFGIGAAQGAPCADAAACASGFCAGGVCCDSACAGPCDVCSEAAGAAADGTCATVVTPTCAGTGGTGGTTTSTGTTTTDTGTTTTDIGDPGTTTTDTGGTGGEGSTGTIGCAVAARGGGAGGRIAWLALAALALWAARRRATAC